jgi:hypothetical protein
MTNAEMTKHFASLPPDEEATLTIVEADTGFLHDEIIDAANKRMLEQIDDEHFINSEELPDDRDLEDDEEKALANKGREKWIGVPVIFFKY